MLKFKGGGEINEKVPFFLLYRKIKHDILMGSDHTQIQNTSIYQHKFKKNAKILTHGTWITRSDVTN